MWYTDSRRPAVSIKKTLSVTSTNCNLQLYCCICQWIPMISPLAEEIPKRVSDFCKCIMKQELKARDFDQVESSEIAGKLYVFPNFQTARIGQKLSFSAAVELFRGSLPFPMALSVRKQRLSRYREGRCLGIQEYSPSGNVTLAAAAVSCGTLCRNAVPSCPPLHHRWV